MVAWGGEAATMSDTICPYCGEDYGDPDGPSDDYMYHGHILWDCPNPDKMERAYLNASLVERAEVWPNGA